MFSDFCREILRYTERILDEVKDQRNRMDQFIENAQSLNQQQNLVDENLMKNKVRQYNSIRKYLNPTTAVLLPMEMFGHDSYVYRADEKQFSKELMTLSPIVYEHMRTEWRFILPPKETVEQWGHDQEDEFM